MTAVTHERVICYVDGFNLYFGLQNSGCRKHLWLNIQKMAECLLKGGQDLVYTKYFTARISGAAPTDFGARALEKDAKRQRQSTFLEALDTLERFETFEGQFLNKQMHCKSCSAIWTKYEEKMTDVNIATELLVDAFGDKFDVAIIVSGDSDLVPPIRAIRSLFPAKRVVSAFPPGRSSDRLRTESSASFHIYERTIRRSQFPQIVKRADGFELHKPVEWN